MLILAGKGCSGKDTVCNLLCESYGFKKLTTYTTRPKRKGERNGREYYFISDEDFKQKIDDGFFAEYKLYHSTEGDWYYGTSAESVLHASDKEVAILTPDGVRDLNNISQYKNRNYICYIYANLETIKERFVKRGDDPKEAERRISHDIADFKGFEYEANRIVYNQIDSSISDVAKTVVENYKKWCKNR